MGSLYVIGTPIGNLEDITFRAVRLLGEVSLIAAEDTRVTRRLLNHLGLRAQLVSCNEHNWRSRIGDLLATLEESDVALVTDAGMPCISDPGAGVVAAVAEAGYRVEVIPGPSAITTALAASGMPSDAFMFLGYLPRRGKARQDRLSQVSNVVETLVFFEAPHRLRPTLTDLLAVLGDRQMVVCREMTKLHEEVCRGRISMMLDHFVGPRGEFVLVVAGANAAETTVDLASIVVEASRQLAGLRGDGARAREAVARVTANTGLPRREVYRLWLESGGAGDQVDT